jgi:hypothetical protein
MLIFFSETTGPIETKLGTNVRWMFMFMFFVDQKYTKETRGPKVSKSVYPYIYEYKLFIVHLFLMSFLLMHS